MMRKVRRRGNVFLSAMLVWFFSHVSILTKPCKYRYRNGHTHFLVASHVPRLSPLGITLTMKCCGSIQLDAALLFLILANYVSFIQVQDLRKQGNHRILETRVESNQERAHKLFQHDGEPFATNLETTRRHRSPYQSLVSSSVAINSSWIENLWIPPHGYRLYSSREMRLFFSRHSILFVGDSTARRTYATLYAILNATTTKDDDDDDDDDDISFWDLENPAVIDINKKQQTEVCDELGLALCRHHVISPHSTQDETTRITKVKRFDLMGGRCPSDIEALAKSSFQNRMKDYSIIIISMGPAELNDMCEIKSSSSSSSKSKKKKPLRDYIAALRELFALTESQPSTSNSASSTIIVWKTMGNIGWSEDQQGLISLHKAQYRNIRIVNRIRQHEEEEVAQRRQKQHQHQHQHQQRGNASMNERVDESVQQRAHASGADTRVTVVDWGKVLEPRSYPYRDRIVGDIPPHYGLEARLVFLQMLMNHLIQHERNSQRVEAEYSNLQ